MSEREDGFKYGGSVSLKEYVEARLTAIEKSIALAAGLMDKRLDGMNEFREQLKAAEGRFPTRDELYARLAVFEADIRTLREKSAITEGKASMGSVYLAIALGLLGVSVAVASILR